jgi:glycosyltransferase involved in cell wall biosynthesis
VDDQTLLTVLIDTYNYGRFIEEAIESVLTQDFEMEHVEILVVDDGSTDDTAERVTRYGARVRYLQKANGGQASALNLGFAKARGEIVVLLDADDYFLPGKLRRVAEEFRKRPDAGMVYNALKELHTESGKTVEVPFTEVMGFLPEDKRNLVTFCAYPTSCLAFRRSLVEKLLPIPESLRLQADGYIEHLAVLMAPVAAIAEAVSVYRVHGRNLYYAGDGLSREEKGRRIDSYSSLMKEIKGWTRRHEGELNGSRARLFFSGQRLHAEEHRFLMEPPWRLRYFWYLLRQNYVHSSLQTWRFTAFNYLIALASLWTGYRSPKVRYALRSRMIERVQSLGNK